MRENHSERAEKLVMLPWQDREHDREYYLIEDTDLHQTYGELIGKIAYSHWWPISQVEEKLNYYINAPFWCPRDWTIDPLFLACLLRAADICHIDASRAPGFLRALRRPTSASKEHWIFQEHLQQPYLDDDRLRYTSGQPFSLKDAQAWWLCFDTLCEVDHELRLVDALLADYGRRRLAARGVTAIEEPVRIMKYIRTEDWLPVDAHIQVTDLAHLIRQLGGEELYGKDLLVPLRELIQNASDAIRARRIEEERQSNWGDVHVRLGKDTTGEWVEVEDNGIGMSRAVLTGPLLDFGKSYWGSTLMRNEFPGLLSKGFESIGKYGIGFFSVFMWGDRVQVTSRRFDAALLDSYVLEFDNGLISRPIVRRATRQECIREGGTRVRVWLKRSATLKGGLLYPLGRKSAGTLKELCTFLCPTTDVNLYTTDINGKPDLIISPEDWKTIDGKTFLKRIISFTRHFDEVETTAYIDKFIPNLRLITNLSGEIVGRACITAREMSVLERQSLGVNGTVTVGGLNTHSLNRGIIGVFTGAAIRAARDIAIPFVENAVLAQWAAEQAVLISDLSNDNEWLCEAAEIVRACGGHTGKLPIALSVNGWRSAIQISECQNMPDEVLIVQNAIVFIMRRELRELVLHQNVLAVEVGVPGLLDYHVSSYINWPSEVTSNFTEDYMFESLEGAVIEALAKCWSSPLEDVIHVSEFYSDEKDVKREIGISDGKPLIHNVNVIRNPKKFL